MSSPTSLSAVRADAIARRDRGDLNGARTLLERSLEAAAMTSGEDHPEVLTTAHLLAKLHRQAGDLSGARRVLENALFAGTHRHGEDNPLLLSITFDLAEIADELGNRHEARKHYTRVANFGPTAPGFDQHQVQAARAWLGLSTPPAPATQPITLPAPEPLPRRVPAQPPAVIESAVDEPTSEMPHVARHAARDATPELPTRTREPVVETPDHAGLPTRYTPPPQRSTVPEPPRYMPPQDGPFVAPPHEADVARIPQFAVPTREPVPSIIPGRPIELPPPPPAPPPKRGRGMLIASITAALVAVVAAGITVFVVLHNPRTKTPDTAPSGPSGAAAEVSLVDDGDRVTLTWTDPSNGQAQPIVAGGRQDEAPRRMGVPAKGATQTTLLSLNRNYDYCFSILLVYTVDDIRQSDQVCTNRKKASPSPTQ